MQEYNELIEWPENKKLPGPRSTKYQSAFAKIRRETDHMLDASMSQRIWYIKNQKTPSCPICGTPTKLTRTIPVRERACSSSCVAKGCSEKKKETNLQRYGHEHPCKAVSVRQKLSTSLRGKKKPKNSRRLGVELHERLLDEHWLYDQHITQKKPALVIADECGVTLRTVYSKLDACDSFKRRRSQRSKAEHEIAQFVESLGKVPEVNRRQEGIELDVLVDNLAIEHHGLFWHSFVPLSPQEDRYKHRDKLLYCREKNIDLIQVFEHEWKSKKPIVQSMIRNRLGCVTKLRASQLSLNTSPDKKKCQKFLDENHIQGNAKFSIGITLEDNDQNIMACMTFRKPRFNKKYDIELIRFATKLDHRIYGAASKIMSCLPETQSVISYCDLRYGSGKLYKALGFEFVNETSPSYTYWHPNTCEFVSRYSAMKSKLPSLLGDSFDETKSEAENMAVAGYRRLWDAGTAVYVYKRLLNTMNITSFGEHL